MKTNAYTVNRSHNLVTNIHYSFRSDKSFKSEMMIETIVNKLTAKISTVLCKSSHHSSSRTVESECERLVSTGVVFGALLLLLDARACGRVGSEPRVERFVLVRPAEGFEELLREATNLVMP